jgi:Chaperone of endosialidase
LINATPAVVGVSPTAFSREDHVHPTDTTRQALIVAGTTAQYYRGDKTFVTLDKAAVGLANVDNTSDAAKPVSTAQAAANALNVLKAGDTMTGNLTVDKAAPWIILNKTNANSAALFGQQGGLNRWAILPGSNVSETGSNVGSDFSINRYNDAGTFVDNPLTITRSTGKVTIANRAVITAPTGLLSVTGVGAALNIGYAGTGFTGIAFRCTADAVYPNAFYSAADALVGYITTTSTTTSYATSSDERLKEDLKSFDAGNIIDDTQVFDFKWKSTGARAYGVIAQQAVVVYAEPITYNKEVDRYFVDYSKYVPVILQELKALRARVAELEAKP